MPLEIVDPLPLDAFFKPSAWPRGTGALMTTRAGGVSEPPFDSLNLKAQTDDPLAQIAVAENRRRFATTLGATPVFLDQVHGTRVVRLGAADVGPDASIERADASITTVPGIAARCWWPTACRCCSPRATAARWAPRTRAGAGWPAACWRRPSTRSRRGAGGRGRHRRVAGCVIGPTAFEVGADVLEAFHDAESRHFAPAPARDGVPKWTADLAGLAEARLRRLGLTDVTACGLCTVSDASRFFSYRRDRLTGRMAAAAWIDVA